MNWKYDRYTPYQVDVCYRRWGLRSLYSGSEVSMTKLVRHGMRLDTCMMCIPRAASLSVIHCEQQALRLRARPIPCAADEDKAPLALVPKPHSLRVQDRPDPVFAFPATLSTSLPSQSYPFSGRLGISIVCAVPRRIMFIKSQALRRL